MIEPTGGENIDLQKRYTKTLSFLTIWQVFLRRRKTVKYTGPESKRSDVFSSPEIFMMIIFYEFEV